jgi:hypothetical protein
MAVSRVQTSSVLQGFPKYRSMLGGNAAFNPSSYESIATVTGTGSSAVITFSSIPSTYKHLQIRGIWNTASTGQNALVTFNGDTASNYSRHYLFGDGSGATATGAANTTSILMYDSFSGSISTTIPAAFVLDIHDYSSTTKNKTMRNLYGMDANNATYPNQGVICLGSGLWRNTAAISSVTITGGANFTTSSVFSLYGIKGA